MRVFDTFVFDGELALLQHRLAELYELVDRFVLVEAKRTYCNEPKPLCFAEHREQFSWADDKICAIALDNLGGPQLTPRERAAIQRNAIRLGLRDAAPDDVVLILDADEIPSRALLQKLRREGLREPGRLAMTRHYEFLNTLAPASPCCPRVGAPFPMELGAPRPGPWTKLDAAWFGHSGVAVRYMDLCGDPARAVTPSSAFELRFGSTLSAVIDDAGRHLTAVDSAARLERKLGRVFHSEYASDRGMSVAHLAHCRRFGIHHRGWWYAESPQGALPEDLARLAARHPEMMRRLPMSRMPLRKAMRSWAWLRTWQGLSDPAVRWVDDRLTSLLPLLLVPLLLADWVRGAVVLMLRFSSRSAIAPHRPHKTSATAEATR